MPAIIDVLIIGAGPASLALAARLAEPAPASLFTDEEHRRCYRRGKTSTNKPAGRSHGADETTREGVGMLGGFSAMVIDAEGAEFLARWKRLFRAFDIQHLRSPMFFHVHPAGRDALWEFAFRSGKVQEGKDVVEIEGVVGAKMKKKGKGLSGGGGRVVVDERERRDYFAPSREVFEGFVEDVVDRYGLRRLVRKGVVEGVRFDEKRKTFAIKTNGGMLEARTVVVATGPPGLPHSLAERMDCAGWPVEGATHSFGITEFPTLVIQKRLRQGLATSVAIVGGGLTAAQLVDLALRRGVGHVYLLVRGTDLKVKPFDVDLEWIGKFRDAQHAAFWGADRGEERLQVIRAARGGGSITGYYAKKLRHWESEGRLTIIVRTTVVRMTACVEQDRPGKERRDSGYSSDFDRSGRKDTRYAGCQWSLETSPSTELGPIDHVYFATGSSAFPQDHRQGQEQNPVCNRKDPEVPHFLQDLQRTHPIPWIRNGPSALPSITDDLAWSTDVPLFFTGALAALHLGPGAANLEGTRLGAERCARAIEEWLAERQVSPSSGKPIDRKIAGRPEQYWKGDGGRFDYLRLDDEV